MTTTTAATVHLGRLERRGLILGLSAAQTAAVTVAVLIAVFALYTGGALAVVLTAPAWATLSVAALVCVGERPMMFWLPVVGQWHARRSLGQTRYLTTLTDQHPAELALPGISGRLRVLAGPTTNAALLLDRKTATVTAMLQVSGTGFVLADEPTQQLRVVGWGRLLAGLCQQPDVVRLQVLQRSLPGSSAGVRRWWADYALASAPWATRVLADLVADSRDSSDRHECFLAVAVRSSRSSKRGLTPAALTVVEQRLLAIQDAARAADLQVHGWVTPGTLPAVLRGAYDPQGAKHGDLAEQSTPTGWVGPMGVQEQWAYIRTDSAHHAVFWVQAWPRSEVHAGFLQPLLLARGARRAFSLIAEPLPPAKALRDIRRVKAEYLADTAQRNRIGQLEDESIRAEAVDLARREQELVAGHGDLTFVGLLTVSAPTAEELDAACSATESAAAQAMCELRRLVGQQGQAFTAAALPLARSVS